MNENETAGQPDQEPESASDAAAAQSTEAPSAAAQSAATTPSATDPAITAPSASTAPPAPPIYPAPVPPTVTAAPAFTKPITRKRAGLIAIIAGASILAVGSAAGGVAAGVSFARYSSTSTATAPTTTQTLPDQDSTGDGSSSGNDFSFGNGYGQSNVPSQGGTSDGTTTQNDTSTATTPNATDTQATGVVLIDTELKYLGGEAAGTGIVLTSTGEILTNNHVVEGSTSITVTIAATGKEYTAEVVGTDATNDIAVLQLEDASGLATASLDTTDTVALGDTVTGVGNAEGQGYLSAAAGQVTALEQQITVADEVTGASKSLEGLIETDAAIVSGDSGGPLLDADGEVVGIDTAASSNTADPTGYAIPIADALTIVKQIESGTESDTVTLGYPAFFGVELSATDATTGTTTASGAAIAGVIEGTPAADAGLAAGDTITKVDSTVITTGDELSTTIAGYDAGDSVKITYTDSTGSTQTVTVTLIEGPAA